MKRLLALLLLSVPACAAENGGTIKVQISATVINATEIEALPEMGPHPYPASEIVVTDDGWFHVYNPDDDFYTVTVSDGNFTVNY